MKQLITLFLFTLISLSSCQNLEIEDGTPECIEDLIKDFDKNQSCEVGVSVKRYTFQEEFVFVFDPGFCGADMQSEVVDSDCNSIGFLGGFAGNISINGEAFFSNALFESTVWEG